MSSLIHERNKRPFLFSVVEIVDSLLKLKRAKISDELWLSLYSFRKSISFEIDNLIRNWKSLNSNSKTRSYSYSNIITWKGAETFKIIFIDYLSRVGHIKSTDFPGKNSETYLRLSYSKFSEDLNHPSEKYDVDRFTEYVSRQLGFNDDLVIKDYCVMCYLGIVSSSTSSSKLLPRYEINVYHNKEYPDVLDNLIELITDFYFGEKRMDLEKLIVNNNDWTIYKLNIIKENDIPGEFLRYIFEKIECITNNYCPKCDCKDTKLFSDALYRMVQEYINLLKNRDMERFKILIEDLNDSNETSGDVIKVKRIYS